MTQTPEQRAEQSGRMRQIWAERRAKAQGYQESPVIGIGDDPEKLERIREETREAIRENREIKVEVSLPTGDKWQDLPLAEALQELAKLQKEVRRASEVIGQRTTPGIKIWACWTALHHRDLADLPGMTTTYQKCLKKIIDGKEKFIDNCQVNPETGLVDPARCCSTPCIALYQVYQSRLRYKARTERNSR